MDGRIYGPAYDDPRHRPRVSSRPTFGCLLHRSLTFGLMVALGACLWWGHGFWSTASIGIIAWGVGLGAQSLYVRRVS